MTYKEFAIDLARKGGAIIKQNFTLDIAREWKEDNTPVTKIDLEINQFVIDAIKKEYPDHNVLAEEGSDITTDSELLWVCDPIDGTIPFTHGIPTSVFTLTLVKNGEPQMGVIYDPYLDRMFFAEKGKGAFLNNKPIRVNDEEILEHNLVAFNTGNATMRLQENILKEKGKVMFLGSASYSSGLLSCGQFVGVIYSKTSAHDGAVVKILIEEAGGKVTDLAGNEQRYDREINGFIASNGKLHDWFVNQMKKES